MTWLVCHECREAFPQGHRRSIRPRVFCSPRCKSRFHVRLWRTTHAQVRQRQPQQPGL